MSANTNDFQAKLPLAHRALMMWYKRFGRRELPWRNTRDAYRIYISEIMLQQTQVKTVLERYYEPFFKRFPTLKTLGKAKPEEVIKQWEGLGYYSRARNCHAAAQQCKGVLPQTVQGLMALPGIGRNTASAVACFAYGAKVPVMEANVKRVLCRVFAIKKPDEKRLWEKARVLLDAKNAFDYNQAMMDIGALVCTRRNPRCGECPLATLCKGKATPEVYPSPKKAKPVPVRRRAIVVFEDARGRFYVMRRDTRFLGGLYGFMEYEMPVDKVSFMGRQYALAAKALLGAVTQAYSHFVLDAKVYHMRVPVTKGIKTDGTMLAVTLAQIARLPLSAADDKVVRLIEASGLRARG